MLRHVRLLQRNRLLYLDLNQEGFEMDFLRGVRTIVTDSHFLVPFFVLLAGIALLVWLH